MLMSVDLPAPFSPTSAWTSPRWRSNETRSGASTPGKRLVIWRISRRGVMASLECGGHAAAVRAPAWPAHSTSLPVNLRPCVIPVLDHRRVDVALVDGHRLQQDGRHVLLPVVDSVGRRHRLLLGELDGRVHRAVRERADRLVDGHRLRAADDALHGVLLRVLPGDEGF